MERLSAWAHYTVAAAVANVSALLEWFTERNGSCFMGWGVFHWACPWERPCTSFEPDFYIPPSQCPGLIWRLERIELCSLLLRKYLLLWKELISAHKLLNQRVHNASLSWVPADTCIWHNGLCFQFLLEAVASYTKVSQRASIISWGPRFASHKVVPHSFILTSWPSFIIHLALEPFPFFNHLATSG